MPFLPPPNPYIAGKALDDERGFFGRQDILRDVERTLRRESSSAIVLYGQRRIGKTSILLQLYRQLPIPPFVPVYFDLMGKARLPLKQLLYELAVEIANHVNLPQPRPADFTEHPDPFRQLFLPQVYEVLNEDQRPVLLLDEFDIPGEDEPLPESAAVNELFPYLLRLLALESRLSIVFTLGRRAADLSVDFYTAFKANLARLVSALEPGAAEELILQAQQAGQVQYYDSAVERIQALAHNHPYFTQLTCQVAFDRAFEGIQTVPETPPQITAAQVDAAVPEILEAGQSSFQWIWEGLPAAERIVLAAIAGRAGEETGLKEEDISEILQAAGIRILVKELNLAPGRLVQWQMLEQVGGAYRVSVELLRRWIAKNYPLERVKDELDYISPQAERLYQAAADYAQQGDYRRATGQLYEAIKENPNHLKARLLLGIMLRQDSRLSEAVTEFETAYQLDEREAGIELVRTLLEYGASLEAAGDEAGALKVYERVLQISPREYTAQARHAQLWQQQGDRLVAGGDFEAAAKAYRRAGQQEKLALVEAQRQAAELTHRAGQAADYEAGGEWAKAVELYGQLAELEPNNQTWQDGLERAGEELWLAETYAAGVEHLQEQEPARAQQALAQVIARRPNYGRAAELLVQSKRQDTPEPEPAAAGLFTPRLRYGLLGWAASGVVILLLALLFIWFQTRGSAAGQGAASDEYDATIESLSGTVEANAIVFATQTAAVAQAPDTPTASITASAELTTTTTASPAITTTPAVSVAVAAPAALTPTATAVTVRMGTPLPEVGEMITPENFANIRQLAQWGEGMLWGIAVAYSPDGQFLAVASTLGIELYEAQSLTQVRFIPTRSFVQSIAFSPDGALLASSFLDGKILLWQVADGSLAATLEGHTEAITSLAFSPDGTRLASGGNDDTVRIWQQAEGGWEVVNILEGHTGDVNFLAFSPDGQQLASGSDDTTVRLWLLADGSLLYTLEGHTRAVMGVAYAPDGATIASGSLDGTIRLWQAADGSLVNTLTGHTGVVVSVVFSPDGALLASGALDGTVRLWQPADGTLVNTLTGHTGGVIGVSFSPDGAVLASGSLDSTVKIWQVSSGTLLSTKEGHTRTAGSVAFSPPGGSLLASGMLDGTTLLWEVASGTLTNALKGQNNGIVSAAFSPDGALLASGSLDGTARLWQVADGTLLHSLTGHTEGVVSVAFSPDGATLATGSMDGTIKLWQTADGTLLNTLAEHGEGVVSIAFSPDGTLLASGSGDNTVRLWQVAGGALLDTLEGHAGTVGSVTFSPDGATLASGSLDGTIRLWQVGDGALLQTLAGPNVAVWSISFAPDGVLLASGSLDGVVRLWQVADGQLLGQLVAPRSVIWSVAFSSDGKLLATGSPDGPIRLWGIPAE